MDKTANDWQFMNCNFKMVTFFFTNSQVKNLFNLYFLSLCECIICVNCIDLLLQLIVYRKFHKN